MTGPQVPGSRREVSGGLRFRRLSPSGLSVGRPASPWRALGGPCPVLQGSLPRSLLSPSTVFTCLSSVFPTGPQAPGKQVFLHFAPCWTWVSEQRAGGAACRRTGLCTETGTDERGLDLEPACAPPAPGPLSSGPQTGSQRLLSSQGWGRKMRFRTWGRGPSGATGALSCFFVLGN